MTYASDTARKWACRGILTEKNMYESAQLWYVWFESDPVSDDALYGRFPVFNLVREDVTKGWKKW